MKAFTQSSLLEQPASEAGAPQLPSRHACAAGHSERCVQSAPVEPELPLVEPVPVLPLEPVVADTGAQSPAALQKVSVGHWTGRTPRQLPHRPLMQNSLLPHSLESVHMLVLVVLPPPASWLPVVWFALGVPPQANKKLNPMPINSRRMSSSPAMAPLRTALHLYTSNVTEVRRRTMKSVSSIRRIWIRPDPRARS